MQNNSEVLTLLILQLNDPILFLSRLQQAPGLRSVEDPRLRPRQWPAPDPYRIPPTPDSRLSPTLPRHCAPGHRDENTADCKYKE